MGKIEKIIKKIASLFTENTSGVPFLLWGFAGFSIIVFISIFRNEPFIQSSQLLPLLPIASIWFIASDYIKTKKISNPKIHFFLDSLFYIAFFTGIFHLTGEMDGRLFFITLIPAMSAPFFTTLLPSIIFTFFLYSSILITYFLDGKSVTPYATGVIILQSIIGLTVVAMIGYFFNRIRASQEEGVILAEKRVEEKTTELRNIMNVLDSNRNAGKRKLEELEKFQQLVTNRELKMLELKEKISALEQELAKNKKA